MTLTEVRALNLQRGSKYEFSLAPFITPMEEVIPRSPKVRSFDEVVQLEAAGPGSDRIPFVRVTKADGGHHLIAVEVIESIKACDAAK